MYSRPPWRSTPFAEDHRLRPVLIVALLFGLAAAVALVGWAGAGAVAGALGRVGWAGFAAFVATSAPLYAVLGLAWFSLTEHRSWRTAGAFVLARLAREAAAELLPFSTLGGYLVGGRAAAVLGVAAAVAFGTGAVDLVTETLGQIAYLAVAAVLVLARMNIGPVAHAGLAFAAAALLLVLAGAGFVYVQRRALGPLARRLGRFMPAQARGVDAAARVIEATYAHPGRLAASSALHLAGWLGGAAQSWLALSLLHAPLSFEAVVALEAAVATARSVGFVAPAGLGVQEGTYALVGPLFGLPAEAGLALSLLKRGRDLVVGVPTLLAWQAVEGGRLFHPELPVPPVSQG